APPTTLQKGRVMTSLRLGVHIGPQNFEMDEIRRLWLWADEHLDWVSVWDHFYEAPYVNGDSPEFEAGTLMAACAAETKRVRIGCLVFCMLYRNPGLLAKEFVTIDHLSHGRLEIGLGAGWHEAEFKAFGYDFPRIGRRLDMLEEGTRAIKMLLSQPRTDLDGRFYKLSNAACNPKPVQAHVPLWIGGRGEQRTLHIAARHADGWNVPYIGVDDFAHKCSVLDEWCEKEGRDPASIERSVNLYFFMGANAAGAEAQRQQMRRALGPMAVERGGGALTGTPDQVIEQIGRYAEAGATRLNIGVRPPVDWEALDAFAREVAPVYYRREQTASVT
ncbi:MAG TPA: LLM class flavin-dependent oxidoreductase, partial [Dehalococcoidia bacterium]|nr:LLM class flavin-dependent oxidoreductase [Dehalococcoidia bacterium]